jgi:hypothetical protein
MTRNPFVLGTIATLCLGTAAHATEVKGFFDPSCFVSPDPLIVDCADPLMDQVSFVFLADAFPIGNEQYVVTINGGGAGFPHTTLVSGPGPTESAISPPYTVAGAYSYSITEITHGNCVVNGTIQVSPVNCPTLPEWGMGVMVALLALGGGFVFWRF